MPENKWVEHVRKFAKDNNISYACAVSDPACKASYTKTPPKEKVAKPGKEPKSILQRLQERIEKNRMKAKKKPLTEKQLIMKEFLEKKLGPFKRAERISGIPPAPKKYTSTNSNLPSNIPGLKK